MKWLNSNDVMGLMYNKKKVTISVSVCVSTQHDFKANCQANILVF